MLAFLRSKKNSWFVKIFFGTLGFLLVVFFGANSKNQPSASAGEILNINGETITQKQLNYEINQQTENMKRQFGMSEVPQQFVSFIQNNAQTRLTQQTLMGQEVKALGVWVSDDELAQKIKEEFINESGQMDTSFYLERFLPYYNQSTGTSFEEQFRRELSIAKIGKAFSELFEISDDKAKAMYVQKNTFNQFEVIKVPKHKPLAPEAQDATKTKEPDPEAKNTALSLYEELKKGNPLEEKLKELNLSAKKLPKITLTEIDQVLDNEATFEESLELLKLNTKNPYPSQVFEKEDFFYLVKFIDQTPATLPDDKALSDFKLQEKNRLVSELEQAWLVSLKSKAAIKTASKL